MRRNDTRGKAFVPQTTSESVSRRIFGSYPLAPEGLPAVNGKNQDTETSMRAAFMRKPVQPATSCIYSRLVRPRPARVASANMDPAPTRANGYGHGMRNGNAHTARPFNTSCYPTSEVRDCRANCLPSAARKRLRHHLQVLKLDSFWSPMSAARPSSRSLHRLVSKNRGLKFFILYKLNQYRESLLSASFTKMLGKDSWSIILRPSFRSM